MEEIKNVVVKQSDIIEIINKLNDFFVEKQTIFKETEELINEEEVNYQQWNQERLKSDNYNEYGQFFRKIFHNKMLTAYFTIDITYIDGTTFSGKSYEEFMNALEVNKFDSIEKVLINLNISYQKDYKADDYSFSPSNRVSQDVYLKFGEDNIYYSVSGENCDTEVERLRSIILDKFHSLEPRLTDLITKRNKIKYSATLGKSFIVSAILIVLSAFLLKTYTNFIDDGYYKYGLFLGYFILVLFVNVLIPPIYLTRLYSLIIPKQRQEYSTYDKQLHSVDNVTDFVSYPEIQIGRNAKKAGVRESIKTYIKKQHKKNLISFFVSIAIVAVVVFLYV